MPPRRTLSASTNYHLSGPIRANMIFRCRLSGLTIVEGTEWLVLDALLDDWHYDVGPPLIEICNTLIVPCV